MGRVVGKASGVQGWVMAVCSIPSGPRRLQREAVLAPRLAGGAAGTAHAALAPSAAGTRGVKPPPSERESAVPSPMAHCIPPLRAWVGWWGLKCKKSNAR